MRWYSETELAEMGVVSGRHPQVSRLASIWTQGSITLGDNVRIDDFCVLSSGVGGIFIGSHVHIAVYSSLIGRGAISIGDYSNVSSRVAIYSSSDDYSGEWMTNPTIPEALTGVTHAPVTLGRHVVVGAGSVVLPGSVLEDGVAVGALSLVKGSFDEFSIYAGVPAKFLGHRSRRLLELEHKIKGCSG